jgi:hypothetical protein
MYDTDRQRTQSDDNNSFHCPFDQGTAETSYLILILFSLNISYTKKWDQNLGSA